jgi:hypothetical protein
VPTRGRTGATNRRGRAALAPRHGDGRRGHRALEILAGSSLGCTEATLLAPGRTTDLLVDLVATASPEIVHAGKRPIEVLRVRITDAGRLALAG